MSLNKTRIISLVATAYADGIFDIKELDYINNKAKNLKIEKDQLLKIIQNPYANDPIFPTLEIEKLEFMFDIMELIHVDNDIADSEITIFNSYLSKLGFTGNNANSLREKIGKSVEQGNSFSQFIKNNYPQLRL